MEPTSLVYRLHTLTSQEGVQFITSTEVVGLEQDNDSVRLDICYRDGNMDELRAKVVINAAGVDADRLFRLFNPQSPYELDPVRGESYKFYGRKRPELRLNGMNIYPTPESVITPHDQHFTVGIHLTPSFGKHSYPPTLDSTVIVGPKLVPVEDRVSWSGTPVPAKILSEKVARFFPDIREEDLIWHQAGLQARLKKYPDFVVTADSSQPNFINLLGIDSPGLTSCLAIARQVTKMVDGLGLKKNNGIK